MLRVTVPARELWDEAKGEFVQIKECTLQLEHSLLSLSKWESKWKRPFLDKNDDLTSEQALDYIRCMTINPNVDPMVYYGMNSTIINQINAYIDDQMTATWFSKEEQKRSGINREKVTSELIYYWMICHQIPWQAEKWHLNRLLTLIQVCNVKNSTPKQMSKSELMRRNAQLNAKRRAKLGTRG